MTPALYERSAVLAALRRAFGGLRSGRPGVVLISGEAGVGKTSVVEHALAATSPGLRVLRGACDDLVAANPLGPLREATRGLPVGGRIAGGELDEVLVELTAEFGGPPTVLVVEDLHWADDATVDVLAYLARRIGQLRLLLVVTYRGDEVGSGHSAQRLLAAAVGEHVQRLALEPLGADSVGRLAEGSEWSGDLLYAVTGGNPFFVTEALGAPAGAPVPASVADAVLARLRRLPARTRAGVERISVWPGVLDFALAEELLGADLDALAAAEELGVLRVSADGVMFRHELARLATEASLSGLRRRRAQADVTAALRARGEADLSRLVHHAMACGDQQTLAEFAPVAGRRSAALGSHREALAFYAAALQVEDRLPREVRAAVLDGFAWELYNAHRFAEAVDHARRAVDLWHDLGDAAAEAATLGRLARHLFMAGDPDQARQVASEAVARSVRPAPGQPPSQAGGDDDTSLRAESELSLGALLALDVAASDAQPVLARAGRLAGDARPDLVALGLNYESLVRPGLSPDQRLQLLRDSIATAEGAQAWEVVARGFTNLTELLYRYGRYAELETQLDDWLRFARDHGFGSHAFNLELHAALVDLRRGRPAAARPTLVALDGRYRDPGMLAVYSRPALGRQLAREGDPRAAPLLREAWRRARQQRMLIGLGYAGTALLDLAWLTDDRALATEVLSVWSELADQPAAAPLWAEVRRYAQDCGIAVPPAPDCGSEDPWDVGLAGDWAEAAHGWELIGDRYEQARELASSGAAEAMSDAAWMFTEIGATAAATLTRTRLARLGIGTGRRGPSRGTRRNPHGLTDRQVDVAGLVAEGLTNAEIADRLVLSIRTVDAHVSAILTKLGVASRREVARVARSWSRPAARERDPADVRASAGEWRAPRRH